MFQPTDWAVELSQFWGISFFIWKPEQKRKRKREKTFHLFVHYVHYSADCYGQGWDRTHPTWVAEPVALVSPPALSPGAYQQKTGVGGRARPQTQAFWYEKWVSQGVSSPLYWMCAPAIFFRTVALCPLLYRSHSHCVRGLQKHLWKK